MDSNRDRCAWVPQHKPLYVKYHDEEWGVPVRDDKKMFEFLVLESFQAGLSWEIVLNKRDNFRQAFSLFDYRKIAGYDEAKVQELLKDKGIIRNQLKIRATTNNAQRYLEVIEEFGSFCSYFWGFVNNEPIVNTFKVMEEIPASTELSDTIAKDMKQRGFKFLGTTVIYAHMQAVGMVNDHEVSCFRYGQV
ncbi:MAG: DNA-3-methyladenine glycosylase I [Candidatus Marinimicrobia bacterium]|nr:DNA-3-methyladenine glycosylase I [Candidatus Neomarinimicrobiota bacterium]MCF7904703.1 DNA-3-methyladenine glycosylase I [Candidatus Neomarinimicrobiota bacterium]